MSDRALYIADTFDLYDLDHLRDQAGPNCHVEMLGELRQAKAQSKHGDWCAQCAIRAANSNHGLTHLYLIDRRWNEWMEVYKELAQQHPAINGSYSFGRLPQNETDGWAEQFEIMARKSDIEADKSKFFGTGLHFFAAGNWEDGDKDSDLAWPQALWANRYSNAFLIAACDDRGRPANFSSGAGNVLNEGKISVAYPGVQIPVRDPVSGGVVYVNGTSFATPLCAGDITGRGIETVDRCKASWEHRLSIHESWYADWLRGEHHPSFGRGNIRQEDWYEI